jgi:glutaminyl-peptide cyclotransferase
MILLDFVGDRELTIRYESNSSPGLWRKLRAAARRVGALNAFPLGNQGPISDDHLPFIDAGVPSIDLIDFDFPCWHRRCDDMSAVSERSVDAVGETIYELLLRL